jgi:hypothetical protein
MSLIACFILAAKLSWVAAQPINVYFYGIGLRSCAFWQQNPRNASEGEAWIFGFWSATNANNNNHYVGSKTDGPGIIAEVRKTCALRPSATLGQAVADTYAAMERIDAPRP